MAELNWFYGPNNPTLLVKWYGYVSKMPALTYNRVNSVIIKNVIILNIINNIFLSLKKKKKKKKLNKTEEKKFKVTLKTNNLNQV